jgi:hypothetical protein
MNACPVHFHVSIELPHMVLLAPSLTHHLTCTAHPLHWFVYPTHVIIIFSRRRQSLHHIWCPECYTNAIHVRGTFGFDKFDVFYNSSREVQPNSKWGAQSHQVPSWLDKLFQIPRPNTAKEVNKHDTIFFNLLGYFNFVNSFR